MYIVLNNVRSAWNVGAIMRTCDAIGARLILIGYTPKPEGKTLKLVSKTSIGAEKSVEWQHFDNFRELLEWQSSQSSSFKNLGIEISDKSKLIYNYLEDYTINKSEDVCLWFGNELSGLEPAIIRELDAELHLPMNGIKESLNVASTVCAVGYLFLQKEYQLTSTS